MKITDLISFIALGLLIFTVLGLAIPIMITLWKDALK